MSDTGNGRPRGGPPGFDRLRQEAGHYMEARTQRLLESAGHGLGGLVGRLNGIAQDGGVLTRAARGMAEGRSPLRALASAKAGDVITKVKEKVKEKVGVGAGGGRKTRTPGGGKMTNIVEVIHVGVPVRRAYDQWTQLQDFSRFAKGVRAVSLEDEIRSDWTAKIAFSTRTWKATVVEQIPDQRIVWTTEGAKGTHRGAVSFHPIAENLTLVVVEVEYFPSGFMEKTGNLWRAQGRRLRLDLKHFQRHVTFGTEEVEGWRGEIRDGEVVRTHEEAVEEEERAAAEEEPEAEEEAEEEEGAEAPEEEEGEEEGEEEAEEEEEEELEPEAEEGYAGEYEEEGYPEEGYEEEPAEEREAAPRAGDRSRARR